MCRSFIILLLYFYFLFLPLHLPPQQKNRENFLQVGFSYLNLITKQLFDVIKWKHKNMKNTQDEKNNFFFFFSFTIQVHNFIKSQNIIFPFSLSTSRKKVPQCARTFFSNCLENEMKEDSGRNGKNIHLGQQKSKLCIQLKGKIR